MKCRTSNSAGKCSRAHELLLLCYLVLLPLPASRANLLFYEGFDYTVGESLGEGSSVAVWGNPKSNITIAPGSLTYDGLQEPSGNRVSINGGTSNLDGARTVTGAWASQTNGTLFFSFLLRLNNATGIATSGTGTPIVNISREGSTSQQLISLNLINSAGLRLGVLKYPSSSTPVSSAFFSSGPGANLPADGSTTCLVVAKYEWVDGPSNDVVTVWVNPENLGGTEDTGNKVFTSAGADGTANAGRFYIDRGPSLSLDELRLGRTWADVTPVSGAVVPRQARITASFLDPAGFVLRGTNGPPSQAYLVLRSTDLFTPAHLWTAVATNWFDAGGNFDTTNPLPADASRGFYRLQSAGPLPSPPSVTAQPADVTTLAGESVLFSVAATGSAPLAYQWYFNQVPIPGGTTPSHSLSSVGTQDAGEYQVVITNSAGSVTSAPATLTVVPASATATPDGYASVGTGTTGGAGGPIVTASTFEDFKSYVDNTSGPFIVLVQGTLNLGSSNVRVRDNKTLIGVGTNATLIGNLKVYGNDNVILRNLTFTNPDGVGDGDGLTLQQCQNVWVDHCTFVDCDDGTLDISHGADWVTVSWCHFHYTNPANDHRFSNLVGHSDTNAAEDAGKLHVTWHHNWWGNLVHERMPRVRFGRVHLYNNYYHSPGNNYCIRAAIASEILVQNNYFEDVKNVWELYRTTGIDGKVFATGNIEVNTTWSNGGDSSSIWIPGTDDLSAEVNGLNPLPYVCAPDPAAGLPAALTNHAGAGRGLFAP